MSKITVGDSHIEIFGNSHAAVITGAPPSGKKVPKQKELPFGRGFTDVNPDYSFRTWFLGPILAYNFRQNHLQKVYKHIKENPKVFQRDNVVIMLAVGEIDCRVHLPKYVGKRSVENVVEECVLRYHEAILELAHAGHKVAVMGAIPSLCDESLRKKMSPKEQVYNMSGDTFTRNKVAKSWEEIHSSLCNKDQIPYVSIYRHLVDDKGMTNESMFCDFIHLSHEKTINHWLSSFEDNGIIVQKQ